MAVVRPVKELLKKRSQEKQTRDLEFDFDKLMKKLKASISLPEAKILLSKIKHRYPRHFMKTSSIDELYLSMSLYISWFNYELPCYILDQLKQEKVSHLREELVQHSKRVKLYFEERTTPLKDKKSCPYPDLSCLPYSVQSDNNHDTQTLVLETDCAWDRRVLEGESCNKTSRKIAAILGKSGHIRGHYREPWLFIFISQKK